MYLFIPLILLFNILITSQYKITTKPSTSKYKNYIPLFWKIANNKELIGHKPKRYIFNEYPIALYKDLNNKIIATSDICIHRGASLSHGKLLPNNCLQCPYHGWEYKNGLIEHMPGCPDINKKTFGVPQFEIKEINNDVYIRPTYDINSEKGNIYNHTIYIPPEANDDNFVRISGFKHIKRPNFLITENVLDMMHISYVHSFGNNMEPVPFEISYEDIDNLSGRTTFHYNSGPTSMSRIIGGTKNVVVENEFHLPDATVTRVKANDITKTIITHCYPIGKNESILHYDLYRNFLKTPLFDPLFEWQMDLTLQEDIDIINYIYDDYLLGFMSSKYDITQIKYREKKNKILKMFDTTQSK